MGTIFGKQVFRIHRILAFIKYSILAVTGVTDWAGKLPRPPTPEFPTPTQVDKPTSSRKHVDPKEKITSNIAVLEDASVGDWSVDFSERSLATTTATIQSHVSQGISPLRAKINENLKAKGKMNSIHIPAPISAPTMSKTSMSDEEHSLPEDSVYPDSTEGLNAAMLEDLDTTLDELQKGSRKRPRGLLLGKLFC